MGLIFGHKGPDDGPAWLADQVAAGDALLVEFTERDAPTCRLEGPIVAKVHHRFGDRVRMIHVDVKTSPADAAAYAVTAVPTFVLFVHGEEKGRLVGYQSVDDLTGALDRGLPSLG
jgi:thioredoxin 1